MTKKVSEKATYELYSTDSQHISLKFVSIVFK